MPAAAAARSPSSAIAIGVLVRADGQGRRDGVEAVLGGVAGGVAEPQRVARSASLGAGVRERADGRHPLGGVVVELDHLDAERLGVRAQRVSAPLVLLGGVDVGVREHDRDVSASSRATPRAARSGTARSTRAAAAASGERKCRRCHHAPSVALAPRTAVGRRCACPDRQKDGPHADRPSKCRAKRD